MLKLSDTRFINLAHVAAIEFSETSATVVFAGVPGHDFARTSRLEGDEAAALRAAVDAAPKPSARK